MCIKHFSLWEFLHLISYNLFFNVRASVSCLWVAVRDEFAFRNNVLRLIIIKNGSRDYNSCRHYEGSLNGRWFMWMPIIGGFFSFSFNVERPKMAGPHDRRKEHFLLPFVKFRSCDFIWQFDICFRHIHLFVVCIFGKVVTSWKACRWMRQNNSFLFSREKILFRRHGKNFFPVISCFGWKVLAIRFHDQWNSHVVIDLSVRRMDMKGEWTREETEGKTIGLRCALIAPRGKGNRGGGWRWKLDKKM